MTEKPRLKVLFVVHQTENRANGGVLSITHVAEHLEECERMLLTQRETPVNERWRAAGAEVRVWAGLDEQRASSGGAVERVLHGVSTLRSNWRVARLVRSERIDVVHCNDIRSLWFSAWGARAAGADVVFNVRDIKEEGASYGWKWRAARLSRTVLALSSEMRHALVRRLPGRYVTGPAGDGPTSVEYIYSIVEPGVFRPAKEGERERLRERLAIPIDTFAVGYVAAVTPKKKQLELIRHWGPRLRDRRDLTVYMVGDCRPGQDEYARRCTEAVRELGLEERVVFTGYRDDVQEWYRALDVVALASIREGMARSMIESLASGTPVVSFDVCSSREILRRHECGYVVPWGDYDGLIARIDELAEREDLRRSMGRSGREVACRLFRPDSVASQYRALYERVGRADEVS